MSCVLLKTFNSLTGKSVALLNTVKPNHLTMEALDVAGFISSSEAAKRLNVTSRSITRWIESGKFPGAFKANPSVKNSPFLIPLDVFEEFEASRKTDQEDNTNK